VPFVGKFPLQKKLLNLVPLKMDISITRKYDRKKCENNINQKLNMSGTKPCKISKVLVSIWTVI
jgi:hypothetical protein